MTTNTMRSRFGESFESAMLGSRWRDCHLEISLSLMVCETFILIEYEERVYVAWWCYDRIAGDVYWASDCYAGPEAEDSWNDRLNVAYQNSFQSRSICVNTYIRNIYLSHGFFG